MEGPGSDPFYRVIEALEFPLQEQAALCLMDTQTAQGKHPSPNRIPWSLTIGHLARYPS